MADKTQRESILGNLSRMGNAYVASAEDYCRRQSEINFRYLDQAIRRAGNDASVSSSYGSSLRHYASTSGNYLLEMARVPWFAAGKYGAALAQPETPAATRTMYFINEEDGWCELNDTTGAPVLLPARVQDAFQAQAIYAVSRARAQAALDDRDLPFTALDLGQDESAFVIFIIQYKEGDLGAYNEIGFGIYVTPTGQPNAVAGMYIMELPVNTNFAKAAGAIWGLPKTTETLTFETGSNQVDFTLSRLNSEYPLLKMTVPRGGTGASTSTPHCVYAMINGKPHKFTLLTTGRGEGSQTGGIGISLKLGDGQFHLNDPLWKMLDEFQLTKKSPILYQWTEHQSLEFGAASAIP